MTIILNPCIDVLDSLIKTIELQRLNQDTNVRKGMNLALDIIHAKRDALMRREDQTSDQR